jgi:hypothetical protein
MRHETDKNNTFGTLSQFGIDTAFVLFFLALEYGRAVRAFSIDGILMAITMVMLLVLPYFLPSNWNATTFMNWLTVRSGVALAGLMFGAVFGVSLGVVLPASLKFMPMTFLILASMISCYIQFYGLMRLRLAK